MAQHNALGLTGGAGGEQHIHQAVVLCVGIMAPGLAALGQLTHRDLQFSVPEAIRQSHDAVVQQDPRAGDLQHIAQSGFREAVQHKHIGMSGLQCAIHRCNHIRCPLQAQRHALACLQLLVLDKCRDGIGPPLQLGKGHGLSMEDHRGFLALDGGHTLQDLMDRAVQEGGGAVIGGVDQHFLIRSTQHPHIGQLAAALFPQCLHHIADTSAIEGDGLL